MSGKRIVVTAILDTGAGLTLVSQSLANRFREIPDAQYVRLPKGATPVCSGAYGDCNSSTGCVMAHLTFHDSREGAAGAAMDVNSPGMVTHPSQGSVSMTKSTGFY